MGDRTCSAPGCPRSHCARGYCNVHYKNLMRYGDPRVSYIPPALPSPELCAIERCPDGLFCRGWCIRHYARWKRTGDPLKAVFEHGLVVEDGKSKRCTKCLETKPIDQFAPAKYGKLNRRSRCLPCEKTTRRGHYRRDPERHKEYTRQYQAKYPERIRVTLRVSRLRRQYGMTLDDFDAMLALQDARCLVCRSDSPRGHNWAIDHCHATGRVRGILCNPCNTSLGLLRENVQTVIRLARYIKTFERRGGFEERDPDE